MNLGETGFVEEIELFRRKAAFMEAKTNKERENELHRDSQLLPKHKHARSTQGMLSGPDGGLCRMGL
jgi:hypothetical protein